MTTAHSKAQFQLGKWQHFLALGFGSGLAPKAPGTFGTLAALPLVWLLSLAGQAWLLLFILFGSLLGIYVCGKAAADVGEHDHGAIVWDEIIGFALTMLLVPISWQSLLLGFILFRLFDILKPWPISWFDRRVHGGFGIMLDDLLAALPALAILHLLVYLSWLN
ncbi:phosphatidylglycerophosphatase A [Alishewanella sp. 16-MA]|uniref:Phosphatidylglycerophosphatase A n=1 Tax=Alishewanella maricola TaxID=2795740 RepID=A0ABS8C0P9_9ALTE|nr:MULTISPECIES: phosphatidylglycerophosphatase A [Alishewanella]MDP4946307.1 phosphatidylglycerophosphatase A [Alishewanella sp.]MCB5225748.1 phosphatidylglycerophosphatase A [Alishewanella maricola]MDP5037062.1 phosphatidylglycerophosphatase A [Alishewanella sp.]MDP5187681.1 phosphatidylglycerophosphatase A [Alishewanella sp.]MDP5458328.1 phosphatidylglycerophosphatase A [Alishewanella sp. SMS8]